ncbi:sensor histidine kinase [Psychromonas ossibalaenae]|uniref:sensor histidine kinase n=1 Tax=Psychromonas ossibalaenae TaxID=444922 RepID=UPI00036BCEC5|nr:HAMP domain-containing sensor histidine kinase [Psychromonas ossibalaenae]
MEQENSLNFSTILATSTHDMKNSLFMLLQSIENLDLADNLTAKQHQAFADLHYQTSRINGTLMQLLALYRDEQNQLPIYIEENSVAEMLQEVIDRNRLYLNSHDVSVTLQVDPELTAYFDQDLITYLIGDIFVNALRHTHTSVSLHAFIDQQYLNIQVEDDGEGYPEHMLAINQERPALFNAGKGRSGLGLLFAKRIASEHKTKQLQGHILLENKTESSGSIFTLRLP